MSWLAAEVLRLRRMRLAWVLLLVMLAFEALMISAMAYWVERSPDARDIGADERERAITATSFPRSIPSTLSFLASLGPLFAIILAARLVGDDYPLGTARQLVSMGMDRSAYIAAKFAGAAAGCLFLLVGGVVGGAAVSLVVTMAFGRAADFAALTLPFLGEVARGAGIACFTLALYSALTVCAATVTRSAAAATAIGILVISLEASLVGSLATRFAAIAKIAPYSIGHNVNVLLAMVESGPSEGAAGAPSGPGAGLGAGEGVGVGAGAGAGPSVGPGAAAGEGTRKGVDAPAGAGEDTGAGRQAAYAAPEAKAVSAAAASAATTATAAQAGILTSHAAAAGRAFAVLGCWFLAFIACSLWTFGHRELGESWHG